MVELLFGEVMVYKEKEVEKMATAISSRKRERWIRSHVYIVYYFRLFYRNEAQAKDSKEKEKWRKKKLHLSGRIEIHSEYGKTLGFGDAEIKDLSFRVVQLEKKDIKEVLKTITGK